MYQHSVSAESESPSMASPDASQAAQPVDAPDAAETPEPSHPFRDELARAMQVAAQRERLRIEARIDDDANSHVAKVRERASVEAEELKHLAEDDVSRIRAWCKAEVERIRAEADIQVGERRDRLEEHLGQHASIIDGEIDRVSEAVEGYRHELEVFFVALSAVKDPSEIARLADTVPGPPDFELIRAIARADAVGRLSDLETAAGTDTPATAEAPVAEEAPLAETTATTPLEAEPVPVMDPAFARSSEASTFQATLAAEIVPAAEVVPAAESPISEPMPAAESPTAEAVAVAESPMAEAMSAEAPSVAEATPTDAPGTVAAPVAETATAPEPVGVMDPALAEKAEADAAVDAAAESPAPELVTAGGAAAEPNAATRFLRSLTAWGSSDHGSNGHK
jgi:hypothetical protein